MMLQKAVKADIKKIITYHSLWHTALLGYMKDEGYPDNSGSCRACKYFTTMMIYTHISGADIWDAMIDL